MKLSLSSPDWKSFHGDIVPWIDTVVHSRAQSQQQKIDFILYLAPLVLSYVT